MNRTLSVGPQLVPRTSNIHTDTDNGGPQRSKLVAGVSGTTIGIHCCCRCDVPGKWPGADITEIIGFILRLFSVTSCTVYTVLASKCTAADSHSPLLNDACFLSKCAACTLPTVVLHHSESCQNVWLWFTH